MRHLSPYARAIIKQSVAELSSRCIGSMCEGDTISIGGARKPIGMKTCAVCWTVWELRRLLEGCTEEQKDDRLKRYEKEMSKYSEGLRKTVFKG